MINQVVQHLATQLNQFLMRSMSASEDVVVVSNLMEHNGTSGSNTKNKIVLFIANIEKDTTPARSGGGGSGARLVVSSPPLYLNLYLMMVANFTGTSYAEGLKFISYAISFFQKQTTFDHQNTPDLEPRIDKLILDIENIRFQDLNNVWGQFGAKYLPSVMYKVRMVAFDDADLAGQLPRISGPSAAGLPSAW